MTLYEEILHPANLHMAWRRVRQNKGCAGSDGISIDDYSWWAKVHWGNIKRGLQKGLYIPKPVKRIETPKPNGKKRLLGIPSVNDRVIQQAPLHSACNASLIPPFRRIVTAFAHIVVHTKL